MASLLLVSCGDKPLLDSHGCYESVEEAKTQAAKAKKDILLVVTQTSAGNASDTFGKTVLESDLFQKELAKNFVCAHIDFGDEFIEKTIGEAEETAQQKALGERYAKALIDNSMVASNLTVRAYPSVFIISKEGYYLMDLNYSQDIATADDLKTKIEAVSEKLSDTKARLAATKKGSVTERMNAINWFLEECETEYLFSYVPLFNEGVELDKNNESGLVSAFYLRKVLNDAIRFAKINDIGSAVKVLEEGARSGKLDGPDKFQAYYQAGFLLLQFGNVNPQVIINYFQAAIEADPTNESADEINFALTYLYNMNQMQDQLQQ